MPADALTPQLDQMLAALTGGDPVPVTPVPEPVDPVPADPKPVDPKPDPAPNVPDEPGETPKPEPGDPEPEKKAAETPTPELPIEEKNALERARTALRRDGVPVAVIDSLDHDKLLKWGGSRAKAQSDVDNAFRELGEFRKSKETQKAETPALSPKETASSTEPAVQPLDLGALGKTLADLALPDEAVNALGGVLKSIDERSAAHAKAYESKVQELQAFNQTLTDALIRIETRDARRELGDRFPQLKDERDYAKVWDKMQKLAPSGAYESVSDLMAEAATILFPEAASRRSTNQETSRNRMNGLPTVSTRKTASTPKTPDESAFDFLKELEKKHGVA